MSAGEKFLIWGGGGHGRVLADLIRSLGGTVVGFVDQDAAKVGRAVDAFGSLVVLDQASFLLHLEQSTLPPLGASAVALGIGDNAQRAQRRNEAAGVSMPTLVHPAAVVAASAKLGPATVVFAGAIVNAGASIGQGVIVNTAAVVEHDCVVEDDAHISPGAILSGGVSVGRQAWVGAGAVVIPGVRVGARSIVGAGAVVIRDVPDDVVVVGNPCRLLRKNAAGCE